MNKKIKLYLSGFQKIFGDPGNVIFVGAFSKEVFPFIEIIADSSYKDVEIFSIDAEEIPATIAAIPGHKHVFCITTDATFRSPDPSSLTDVKLGVLPLFSTGYSFEKLRKSLELIFQADYKAQNEKSQQVLELLENADEIMLKSNSSIIARLDLLYPNRVYFFNQSGYMDWGQQSVLPGGEVSLLTDSHGQYSAESKFSFNGYLDLKGIPVVHYGTCPCSIARYCSRFKKSDSNKKTISQNNQLSSIREKQTSIFLRLSDLYYNPVRIKIDSGVITDLAPVGKKSEAFFQLLELFEEDGNYKKIHEFGIGLNNNYVLLPNDNFLPNEMIEGIHLGLGLTPFTEFHIDLVCPYIEVYTVNGNIKNNLLKPSTEQV